MKEFATLFEIYDNIVFFDTETTGLDPYTCQIIEIAAISLKRDGKRYEYDEFVRLREPNASIPDNIVELTGITDEMLREQGVFEDRAARDFSAIIHGEQAGSLGFITPYSTLMVAHNAHFDLSFVRGWLKGKVIPTRLDFLDTLTVFKDRRAYPHKLRNAIDAYNLGDKVSNTHRAIDDVRALVEVAAAMDIERDDLTEYVNLFGYNPKYGKPQDAVRGVTYLPQPFHNGITPINYTLYAM